MSPDVSKHYRFDFETVTSQQTNQVLGGVGNSGNVLERVVIVPMSVNCGGVSITNGSSSAISLFQGGTSSLSNLSPIVIDLGMRASERWRLTTGSAVMAIAVGRFT